MKRKRAGLEKNSRDTSLSLHSVLQTLLGYGLLVIACYLMSQKFLSDHPYRVFVYLTLVPSILFLYRKPMAIFMLFFLYFNTVIERKAWPVHLIGQIDILPPELLLIAGLMFVLIKKQENLRDLILGTPVRKAMLVWLVVVTFSTLWSVAYLKLPLLGLNGVIHVTREFYLYGVFFLALAFCRSEEDLRWIIKCIFAFAILGSLLHILIFFNKGQGLLTGLFPVFTSKAKALSTGTYYGTTTDYLRLYNPSTPLFRCGLIFALSFYLHRKSRKSFYLAALFVVPVVLQFTRMTWIAYLLAIPMFAPIMKRNPALSHMRKAEQEKRWVHSLLIFFVCALVTYLFGMVLGFGPFKLFSERFLSVFQGSHEESIFVRIQASWWILEHVTVSFVTLLFGFGISQMTADSTYFGLLGALGLLGILTYIWLYYQFMKQGLKIYYRLRRTYLQQVCLGALMSITLAMINGVSGSYIAHAQWIPLLCILYAIPEICQRLEGIDLGETLQGKQVDAERAE